jgi:predicted MPP superfamily phosphohydrolase
VVAQAIQDGGARLLLNGHIALTREDATLYLAGVDDIWERQHDLSAALSGIPTNAPVVLLAHEPDYADEVTLTGKVGLQLSGHSHGGQVRLPLVGALELPWLGEKYDMGLYDVGGMALYVTRGVGMIAPHVRFNCRPEIAQIELVAYG